ncbi:MAG: hypothetical protein QXF65_03735 [Candidatus Korarchaeota archaeon]
MFTDGLPPPFEHDCIQMQQQQQQQQQDTAASAISVVSLYISISI